MLIASVVLCILSTFIYLDFLHDYESGQANVPNGHELISGTPLGVGMEIVSVDLFLLLLSSLICYWLAGVTLRPIQRSIEKEKTFLSNASHELRTPLAVMKTDIEVLLRAPQFSKEEVTQMLESNIEEIDRLARMANELLQIARTDEYTEAKRERVDIAKVAMHSVKKMRSLADAKGVALHVHSLSDTWADCVVDDIERVFFNILHNAITHTLKGGSVSVDVTQNKKLVTVTITDTGAGISARDLPHIFERFYKGEESSGTGLGLPIALCIIEEHGGVLSVQSTKGSGTTVRMSLPKIK
jgi:signal transduction histidine kinase